MAKQKQVSMFVTLKDASDSAHIQDDHIQYLVDRFLAEKKVVIYNAKEALRYYPGMWKLKTGETVMAVKVVCLIGPHAGFA